ncbi:MAG: hypothetical protein V1789_01645 [PVC group bacterium]
MLRRLFKLILLLIAVALVYGFWLLYQDKPPEEKQEFREGMVRVVKDAGRTVAKAGRRVVEKGQEVLGQGRDEEKEE